MSWRYEAAGENGLAECFMEFKAYVRKIYGVLEAWMRTQRAEGWRRSFDWQALCEDEAM